MISHGWQSLSRVKPPAGIDTEIAVIESDGAVHALVEPARWTDFGWMSADTGRKLDLAPTHWRRWPWAERIHP